MIKNLILALTVFVCFSCSSNQKPNHKLSETSLIPFPSEMFDTESNFTIDENTQIVIGDETLKVLGNTFANSLRAATGLGMDLSASETAVKNSIFLGLSPDVSLGKEGYKLQISQEGVEILANEAEGIFRGLQTFNQILPLKSATANWTLPGGSIKDSPAYDYRGAMLDVARHFYTVEEVKKFIDYLAEFKYNTLHLHLTDDQGWRIEIKSWPLLTTEGGKTQVGGNGGGFYTQEQYKDIINYATQKYITIVPEIDMPGHTNAALVAYPELYCKERGNAPELYEGTEVGFSTLCTKNENIYKFVNDVIGEVAALTPGRYIHIGGDESRVTPMDEYIPFINRVQDIVLAHNKIMIGWDEITNANLKSNTIAQFWAEKDYASKAANNNNKLIFSPANKAYLDMQYDSTSKLGLHWAGYIEIDSSYLWEPSELLSDVRKRDILGIEAPLWSETVKNMEDLEYLVFPRLLSLSEVAWTPKEKRNWDSFKTRLGNYGPRLKAQGIDYYASKQIDWK